MIAVTRDPFPFTFHNLSLKLVYILFVGWKHIVINIWDYHSRSHTETTTILVKYHYFCFIDI